ncbi:hypothetical protein, partial [Agrobacterium rosae]|uniref:hypothetical protein n=1 Tax=Agrobacterium rosae TaxID=1972867 RepID=UPI003B9E1D09
QILPPQPNFTKIPTIKIKNAKLLTTRVQELFAVRMRGDLTRRKPRHHFGLGSGAETLRQRIQNLQQSHDGGYVFVNIQG